MSRRCCAVSHSSFTLLPHVELSRPKDRSVWIYGPNYFGIRTELCQYRSVLSCTLRNWCRSVSGPNCLVSDVSVSLTWWLWTCRHWLAVAIDWHVCASRPLIYANQQLTNGNWTCQDKPTREQWVCFWSFDLKHYINVIIIFIFYTPGSKDPQG